MKTLLNCLLLATTICLFAMAACSKNTADPGDQEEPVDSSFKDCKIASVKFDSLEMDITFAYDAKGNLYKVTGFDSAIKKWTETYEYQQDRIIQRDSAPATAQYPAYQSLKKIHELGANGYVSKSYFTEYDGVRDTVYYTYDANGYMTKSLHRHYQIYNNGTLHLSYTETHFYAVVNGNRIKDSLSWQTDDVYRDYKTTVTYGYNTAPADYSINYYYADYYPFLGKKNASLMKSAIVWHSSGGISPVSNFTYDFDTTGKPVTITHSNIEGVQLVRLAYECK